jgi:hypothetical protein
MLEAIEPANYIYTLIHGATIGPNIELSKCNGQASKQVAIMEAMITIYNTILFINGPNFLEVLFIHSCGEYLQCTCS